MMALETAGSWWLTIVARYIHLQEEYIKDEQRSLKRELVRAQEEIKRIQSVPLVIGQFMEAIDQK
jgi:26S proteasome regulatory subunit T3